MNSVDASRVEASRVEAPPAEGWVKDTTKAGALVYWVEMALLRDPLAPAQKTSPSQSLGGEKLAFQSIFPSQGDGFLVFADPAS